MVQIGIRKYQEEGKGGNKSKIKPVGWEKGSENFRPPIGIKKKRCQRK
jgi:hypothetical protein